MERSLNEAERRVLGALLEKSIAQPDYYPMTLNAIVAACNQKQNRHPVMEMDEDTVWQTLEHLRERGLVTMLLPGGGARSRRFKHEVESYFAWQIRERAIMAELLLRGPQTVGELRTRCSRFVEFDSLEAVSIVLNCLGQCEPPMVKELPKGPGQSAVRYAHLLYPDGEGPALSAEAAGPSASHSQTGGRENSLDRLINEVARLSESLADVQRRLESIERQLL